MPHVIGDEERARRANDKIKTNLAENRALARERDIEMARMHLLDNLSAAEVARRLGLSDSAVRLAVRLYGDQVRAEAAVLPVAG
ncbi:hypothetical protein Psi01_59060 [Planobispora siamensis]|uniref:Uncharacterized protein n=1 Tax=Planobispora siamensis TaxID=936338 RepID=A0A8J3SIS3_9ACTN|nr:hypothetical protein Psi01_59060 [Planobispora siamensis]